MRQLSEKTETRIIEKIIKTIDYELADVALEDKIGVFEQISDFCESRLEEYREEINRDVEKH